MAATSLVSILFLAPQAPVETEWRAHLGDPGQQVNAFLRREVDAIAQADRQRVLRLRDPASRRAARQKFKEMLGLVPEPVRTDLRVQVTGTIEDAALGIAVDRLHFQSVPKLYVTANLYRPAGAATATRRPAILYLCGHARVRERGASMGNKTAYHHHAVWFARHGFVCLVLDTLQLGEITGLHAGTHRHGHWWWVRRGYTPAGVEAWNAVRALDLLSARADVDAQRIGVTGRSGGGVGTWFLAAIDERPAVLAPVAGLTDLQDHVVQGCITGHCDCNYFLNYERWDYYTIAALSAPRPLLLSNSDRDRIFPLGGVLRLHAALRGIYSAGDAEDRLGLSITNGPHKDTQDLRVPVFRWMRRWLQKEADDVRPARKAFAAAQLRVFAPGAEPKDARNARIHEEFVPKAARVSAVDADLRSRVRAVLRRTMRDAEKARLVVMGTGRVRDCVLHTGDGYRLPVRWVGAPDAGVVRIVAATDLRGDAAARWTAAERKRLESGALAIVQVVPRGLGPTSFPGKVRDRNQIRRRFYVIGRPLEQTWIYDVRSAVAAVRQSRGAAGRLRMELAGAGRLAAVAIFAAVLEGEAVARVVVRDLPEKRSEHLPLPGLARVLADADLPKLLPAGRLVRR